MLPRGGGPPNGMLENFFRDSFTVIMLPRGGGPPDGVLEKFVLELLYWGCHENVFSIFYQSTSGVCFSESTRKMAQNGGRLVPIRSIFGIYTS